ncbi:RimJ/RimL family protein N-acetyltransferase [Streptomyces griseochromogenes]|uniref:Acetyltransferase n=1 Tax=Streptomyces griseochromogenes TaxID=68214 RepID=A0A1B1AQD7_9ACTN|nr:GNAT family N-acetyltransferase [Streptomyces griseochromogenes]ANP48784.1 acetyltransferase [Streptomyces griseochromogenes]MBP2054053.1 RimJ/RimL family protein N-acetyltransferase [Streptomyces griseochromogenes]
MNRTLPVVRLRVPTDEDAFAWHRLFADPEVMEFYGGRPAELSVYEELTARQRRHDAEHGFCLWTMLDEAGEVIGFTGAQPWPPAWGPVGEIEIGWRLGRAHWGKGYVTAAARETLDRVRAAGVPGVVAMVRPGNERSIAVTRRLGMKQARSYIHPTLEEEALCFRLAFDGNDIR